ncbi:MAG: diguanylate cyclase [Spirochaetales bacterium]|nr:diguanylate cyclase [Spirochaetales bacterium]
MITEKMRFIRKILELFFISLFLFLINLLFPDNPGYLEWNVNPYIITAIITSAYYGRNLGYLSLGFSILYIIIPINTDLSLAEYWKSLWNSGYLILPPVLIGIYIFGMIHNSFNSRIVNQHNFMKKVSLDKFRLQKEVNSLSAVNRELEERVLRQQDSVTALYTQVKALHTQNLSKTLNILISTVQKFSWAEKASIWQYEKEGKNLVMVANIGWDSDDVLNTIESVDSTINGWVFRNDRIFSVRMLLEYENLQVMDTERNILTFPIKLSSFTWGVLNIESMPFTKYNLYTEKLLAILIDLAGTAIERASEYEAMIKYTEINHDTNLPSVSQFFTYLKNELDKVKDTRSTFSVIIIEFTEFGKLAEKFGDKNVYNLLLRLLNKLNDLSDNVVDLFHYKDKNQIGIYYPGIDYDGASLFCLEGLSMINSTEWDINGSKVMMDVIMGYASIGSDEISIEDLLDIAENLLEMQKV